MRNTILGTANTFKDFKQDTYRTRLVDRDQVLLRMDKVHCAPYDTADSSTFLRGPPPNRRRRARTQFDYYAVQRLECVFQLNQYPDIVTREALAEEIGVSEARVQTWFQNKRSRTKRTLRRKEEASGSNTASPTTPPSGSPDTSSESPATPIARGRTSSPRTSRPAASRRRDDVTPTKTSPSTGFRPFYRDFLSPAPSGVGSSSSTSRTNEGLNVNTGLFPGPGSMVPAPWMYAWMSQQQQFHSFPMPSYLPPLFPMPPPWSVTSPKTVLPSSDQLLLSALPHMHGSSPIDNNSPDSTVKSRQEGPKATSTPIFGRQHTIFKPDSEKHVDSAPSSDSDSESVGGKRDIVQDSGYTSAKSDSDDQIDVCS